MAVIHNMQGNTRDEVIDKALAHLNGMRDPALIAQQVMLRGAMHAMRTLLERGVTEENARAMLNDSTLTLGLVHGVARKRGIKLPSFSEALVGEAVQPSGKVS